MLPYRPGLLHSSLWYYYRCIKLHATRLLYGLDTSYSNFHDVSCTIGVARNLCLGPDNRGAEIETPKAFGAGSVLGGVYPSPSRLEGLVSPDRKRVLMYLELERTQAVQNGLV